ncbi:Protein EFR3 -like protein B [Halotydeus destructor]|nr:Protein EFR3 -like protein B [Halotydeus destructor]
MDGIVKSNMEKLSFYARNQPEKLDRIGDYLTARVARDLGRHRIGFVMIAVEAMDHLLIACASQNLNLFVESYLKMVQLLLESQLPEIQLVAVKSFTKFSNIEEDTPSYHRRYDFFVSKFSSLCHDNNSDLETRRMLRVAGLNGLKGVIRKTVSDDLQVDIWDQNHMEKIIPSLLYNMHEKIVSEAEDETDGSGLSVEEKPQLILPSAVAEDNLRELLGKATFGNVRQALKPVLSHLDHHNLWVMKEDDDFVINVFQVIMNSIQNQHSYAVIQILTGHLDKKEVKPRHAKDQLAMTNVRTGIATVLLNIVAIAASDSIGPTVLEIINSLLKHLRSSINNSLDNSKTVGGEHQFQETVINALGEFANNLPDYQKIEIMTFIASKVPPCSASAEEDILLQGILLKSLLKVSTKYKTVNISQAFPIQLLKPLLTMSMAPDPSVRLTVQKIFHQLLDRHGNLSKLSKPVCLDQMPSLFIEKAYRQDVMFMKKYGCDIMLRIYEGLKMPNNMADNYDALFTSLALFCVEMSSEEVLVEILRVALALQEAAGSSNLTETQRSGLHAVSSGLCHLCANLSAVPGLISHVDQVIKERHERAFWMLPESGRYAMANEGKQRRRPSLISTETSDQMRFDKNVIEESLRSSGHDTSRLLLPIQSPSVVDAGSAKSANDLNAISFEIDSASSSPGMQRKYPEEEITFESLKRIMMQSTQVEQEAKDERRCQVYENFKRRPLSELVSSVAHNPCDFRSNLEKLFAKLPPPRETTKLETSIKPSPSASSNLDTIDKELIAHNVGLDVANELADVVKCKYSVHSPPLFAIKFPAFFVC